MIRKGLLLLPLLGLFSSLFGQQLDPNVQRQISEILALKASFSPAMKKMDSDTAFGLLKAQGQLSPWLANLVPSQSGPVRVEIGATPSPALLQYLASIGATVQSASPNNDVLVALVPADKLEAVAGRSDVKRVAAPSGLTTNGGLAPRWKTPAFVGALTSQGYIAHRAKDEIQLKGFTGAGVKVGVLSDSARAARVAALIASGDLPANTVVLPGKEGPSNGTDEGAAMMEIVSDIAPGAQIYFATAYSTQTDFANNILALAAAGCKVIVDDISYFAEGVFQDGPVAQAVNTVTAAGVTYISSAGNSGNLTQGTAGVWEGDFLSAGPITGPIATAGETGLVHNFGSSTYNALTVASSRVSLKWSDPLGASTNDYDVFALNSTGTTLTAFSAAVQNGTQDPLELISASMGVGSRLVVVLFDGQTRALHLNTNRGALANPTTGVVYGHNAAANTISTAAVSWNAAKTGSKPFVGGATNKTETFSSDGPRRIFYNPNGTPITPGNLLFGTGGGTLLMKPDIAGADGVSTKTPNFQPFYGTSAAAPHVAGIAALILQARPNYTPAQVKAAIFNSALDNMAPGQDRDSGYGIAMALQAVNYALAH